MKKFVSLLLAVLMTAALFTGCAKQPQTCLLYTSPSPRD